jgi:hypothetical protein
MAIYDQAVTETPREDARLLPIPELRRRPSLSERALGWFVIFQLIAIPLGSYIKLIPVRYPEHRGELNGELQARIADSAQVREPTQTILDTTAAALTRWGEVSGQSQCWALFASFGVQAAMPVVELHWRDRAPVTLSCYFEPKDPSRYFYWPEPICRLFNFEYRTVVYYWACRPTDITSNPDLHRRETMRTAHDQRRSTTAYLKWKYERYRREHPGTPPPDVMVLKARILPAPPPGGRRDERPASYEVPVARWKFADNSYEVWDPIANVFTTEVP